MSGAYQFRWILPDSTTTAGRKLQYRFVPINKMLGGGKAPPPGPWVTIPLQVVSNKEFDES